MFVLNNNLRVAVMKTINMHNAKSQLSSLVEQATKRIKLFFIDFNSQEQ